MNRNDIMQLAQKAGFNTDHNMISVEGWEIFPYMQRFANLVAAATRERCAQVCAEMDWPGRSDTAIAKGDAADECAAAIRAMEQ